MVVGRGSFIDAFPLFGLSLDDYDALFEDHLDLLLTAARPRAGHLVGQASAPPLTGQGVYPRPVQNPLPVWLGVGGTPKSFARAGALGLPLMVAIIGGETRRFRPLIDLYHETGERVGHRADRLKVGVHSLGYVAATAQAAADDFYPGYAKAIAERREGARVGPPTRAGFDAQLGPDGALLIGERGRGGREDPAHRRSARRHRADHVPDERVVAAARQAHARDRSDRHTVAPAVRERLGGSSPAE